MKFYNGCRLLKEGYECFSPQHVYEIGKGTDEVVLCAPTSRIRTKGDTLGGINLTIRITVPMPEVIRVQTWHHKGVIDRGPNTRSMEMIQYCKNKCFGFSLDILYKSEQNDRVTNVHYFEIDGDDQYETWRYKSGKYYEAAVGKKAV